MNDRTDHVFTTHWKLVSPDDAASDQTPSAPALTLTAPPENNPTDGVIVLDVKGQDGPLLTDGRHTPQKLQLLPYVDNGAVATDAYVINVYGYNKIHAPENTNLNGLYLRTDMWLLTGQIRDIVLRTGGEKVCDDWAVTDWSQPTARSEAIDTATATIPESIFIDIYGMEYLVFTIDAADNATTGNILYRGMSEG